MRFFFIVVATCKLADIRVNSKDKNSSSLTVGKGKVNVKFFVSENPLFTKKNTPLL